MTVEEQGETLQKIVTLVLRENTDDWSEIKISFSGLASIATSEMKKIREDGEEESVFLPDEAAMLYNHLRGVMYQRGKGTWYNAWTTIDSSGASETDFSYDTPPEFETPVDPRSFYEDMRYFPRFVEEIPAWLMEKLKEAKRLEREESE